MNYVATQEYKDWWMHNGPKLAGQSIYSKGAVIWNAALAAPAAPVAAPAPSRQTPIAWIVVAECEGSMVPQYPATFSLDEALRLAKLYGQTKTEVRALYFASQFAAPVTP